VHEVGLARGVGVAAGQRVAQAGVARDDPLEAEELVLDPVDPARPLGRGQERLHREGLERVGEVALGGPALPGNLADQAGRGLPDLAAEECPGQALLVRGVAAGVGERAPQRGVAVDHGGHREQLLGEGVPGRPGAEHGVEGRLGGLRRTPGRATHQAS
jgi:hypothetical protein